MVRNYNARFYRIVCNDKFGFVRFFESGVEYQSAHFSQNGNLPLLYGFGHYSASPDCAFLVIIIPLLSSSATTDSPALAGSDDITLIFSS